MLLLTSTSDKVQVVSTAAVATHVQSSYMDYATTGVTPGRLNTIISTATTTDIVGTPAASTQRNVKHISIRASGGAQTVTVQHTDGTTVVTLVQVSLNTGEALVWTDGMGWQVNDVNGAFKQVMVPDIGRTNYQLVTQTSVPIVPAVGLTGMWFQKWAGRPFAVWDGEGISDPSRLQPGLFGNGITLFKPGSSTTKGTYTGGVTTEGGTLSHPTLATTNLRTMSRRSEWTNVVTTTNQFLGMRDNDVKCWRGNAAGLGGFFFFCRFSFAALPAGSRVFIGLSSLLTGVQVTADPSAAADDHIGLACDLADTNLTLMTKDGTTNTKTAIGAGLAKTANDVYDLYIFCKPNGTSIGYRLDSYNSSTGVVTNLVDSTIATNIPRNTIFMAPMAAISNGTANTTVSTVTLGVMSMYLETDF
jgi:hypothetical protein